MKMAITLVTLCSMLCAGPAMAQTQDTLQKIKQSGVIGLGARDSSFPFSYKTTADANPVGFSTDLCMKVVDAVKTKLQMPNLKVQYTIVTPANKIPLLQNGTIDLECSTTTNTAARAQQVEFAPTHFVSSIAVAVKKQSGITSMAQLDGKTVATVTGSTTIQLLRSYRRSEKKELQELYGKDIADAFLLLSSGRANAMVLDDVLLASLIATSTAPNDYKILDERLRDEPYGLMFRKDDPAFKALVNDTIVSFMKSGEVNGLYEKWFTRPVPPSGVNLNFPMSKMLKETYSNPNNRGI